MIEALLERNRRSIRWLASEIGESPQKVHAWLRGDYAPRDASVWDRMVAAFKGPTASGVEPMPQVQAFRGGTRWIPVYAGLSAGVPGQHHGDVDYIEILDWGSSFERWGRRIEGFSMEPLIHPGDVIIFENRRAEHSHVVHAVKDGEDTCKVLWGQGVTAELRPVNPDYAAMGIEGWTLQGIAVSLMRRGAEGERILIEYPYGLRHRFAGTSDFYLDK